MNSYYSCLQEHEKLWISYHNHNLCWKYLLVLCGNMLVLQKQLGGCCGCCVSMYSFICNYRFCFSSRLCAIVEIQLSE